MTTFVLVPTAAWTFASGYATPRVMLEQGLIRAYFQRANGTLRHLDLAPLGSTRRDTAEWIYDQIEDGTPVKAVARELHSSVATVRRLLLSLELTEEIEAGDWDTLSFDEQGEPVWAPLLDEDGHEHSYLDAEAVPAFRAAAAALRGAVPGDACEPEGTTADELEAALAASLA